MSRISEIEARLEAATPGPWEYGDRYSVCGVMPQMFGEGKCSSCARHGEADWVGRLDINGKKMLAHVHIMDKPWSPNGIVHYDGNGNLYSVVIETDEYGLMDDADAALIASAPTDLRYLLERVREYDSRLSSFEAAFSWLEGWTVDEAIGDRETVGGYAKAAWDVRGLLDRLCAALTKGESHD